MRMMTSLYKSLYPLQISPADTAISILHLHQTYSQMLQVKCLCNIHSNQSLNHVLAGRETRDKTLWEKSGTCVDANARYTSVGRRPSPIPKYRCIYKIPFCQILLYGKKMKRRLNTDQGFESTKYFINL